MFYAHSKENAPVSEWQILENHLQGVADRAEKFAAEFQAGDWGKLAGLWHDLGKYSDEFQGRLSGSNPRKVEHAAAGAQWAVKKSGLQRGHALLLAFAIMGHHGGMPDGTDNEESCLKNRLDRILPDWEKNLPESFVSELISLEYPLKPDLSGLLAASQQQRSAFHYAGFIRMLYSCLVDADFLDTERFMEPERAVTRQGYPTLSELRDRFNRFIAGFTGPSSADELQSSRREILAHCRRGADENPGLFSLTVPTGGGKTLSSLAFALDHAIRHGLRRIIYVIPFTSIIEQNADVFRRALGTDAVVEHHSNFDFEDNENLYGPQMRRSRLACENWDAPVIVTTNVQFFESFFHHKPSRCRKLHNVAGSVVIFDEAQTLPVQFMLPVLHLLRELTDHYRVTAVLCTATQPAIILRPEFPSGLPGVREIIPDPISLAERFRRVDFTDIGSVNWEELAEKIREENQVLCIVNTRAHARNLYRLLDDTSAVHHLSALMTPEHRSRSFAEIRKSLQKGNPCRVISTQLVEAGVDIDFPVVYRSITGLDGLIQAAGRCNRHMRMQTPGRVFLFHPDETRLQGFLRQQADSAIKTLRHHPDPFRLEAITAYFQDLYWIQSEKMDSKEILKDLSEHASDGLFPFRTIADKFRLIDEGMQPVVVPRTDDAFRLVEEIRGFGVSGGRHRRLQRHSVQIYRQELAGLRKAGAVEELPGGVWVLINPDLYDEKLGLVTEEPTFRQAEGLII